MNMLEKVNSLIDTNDIKNLHKLSSLSNVPYTTYRTIFEKGPNKLSLETARQICDFFNLTLDELLDDNVNLPEFIEDTDKKAILKMVRKYPKPNYSQQSKENEEFLKIAASTKDGIDISEVDDETKDIIKRIIERNMKEK